MAKIDSFCERRHGTQMNFFFFSFFKALTTRFLVYGHFASVSRLYFSWDFVLHFSHFLLLSFAVLTFILSMYLKYFGFSIFLLN